MKEKETYRELEIGELPCPVENCHGVLKVEPDNSYKLTCDLCGYIKDE
ncbi:MAG: hypothetical protein GX545_02675 [Fibrobacter sp.]|jgi:predicted nucleic-acid-binding Zn-ribbon protein|nr:hypothetical protein [Fibrobacter sp.]